MSELAGKVLGHCHHEAVVGQGAMATVYKGRHQTLGIPVAVKVMRTDPATLRSPHFASFRERFRREAQLAARVNHPGIVRVLDFGEEMDVLYLVMEYVDGYTLQAYLRRAGSMGEEMAINVIGYMATALQAAHAQNVLHRDLKPANVLVTYDGWVKIADLGLAKEMGQNDLTRADTLVGTPSYMAPENFIAGSNVGVAADIYSLGIMLYEMVAGRPPFAGSLNRAISGHLHGDPEYQVILDGKTIPMPPGLIALLRALLAKKPEARPRDCGQVVELCQARLAELRGGSPQLAADRARATREGDSESSAFRKLSQFMEKNLGATSSEYQGKSVVHTTSRERRIIWGLLVFFVLFFVISYFLTR